MKTTAKKVIEKLIDVSSMETEVHIEDGDLGVYSSIRKRLRTAGFKEMSGAGWGAYGTDMVLTSASVAEVKEILKDTSYFSKLTFRPFHAKTSSRKRT